jgi:Raf kinase inhibitor-like YbhB/YbcL family protein
VFRRGLAVLAALVGVVVLAAACDTGDGKTLRPPTPAERAAMPTTTTSTTVASVLDPTAGDDLGTAPTSATAAAFSMTLPWADGAGIDARFTCDGADLSPAITWTAPPAGTVELALLVVDDDAGGFVHWAVTGIAPASGTKVEGKTFAGATEGLNDFGKIGYGGPCPPKGSTHTYRFALYALSQQAELPDRFTGKDLQAIADPAALTVAELTGTYARPG